MKSKTKKQFVKSVSNVYLNGIEVVKYALDDLVQVSIEDVRGKTLAFEIMTNEKYDELEEKWTDNVHRGDARIVQRALKHFEMWRDGEEE
jgi:predicted short-subunit dehydrogenase-like oxidoreductase (DUF2520 family)